MSWELVQERITQRRMLFAERWQLRRVKLAEIFAVWCDGLFLGVQLPSLLMSKTLRLGHLERQREDRSQLFLRCRHHYAEGGGENCGLESF